jgi:nucleotide-binding universal stress UspA family protein
MMNASLRKILLATDGSREATLAMRAAVDISCKMGAELHVVHVFPEVLPPSHPGSTISEDYSRLAEEEVRELLRKQGWKARVDGVEIAGEHVREGKPAKEISALAQELDAGLVVAGSRAVGWAKRLITGSVSEGLVRGSSRPVLIVRGGKAAWPPARVVVGDDGTEAAERADVLAAEIASLFGAEVVLVRAYENPPEPVGGWSAQDRCELDEALSRRREDLDERAEQLAALTHHRIGTTLIETKAAPAMSLVAGKREEERTLLAVGSRGLGALDRALSRSVSTKVLRSAHGPVLVVPSEKASAR